MVVNLSQSSSLARHRRIHTGKRPYKCAHEGCLKRFVPQYGRLESSLTSCSFCRKTTMVKHQRRSHLRGIHSSELDDGDTSDSDSGESPCTPQHPAPMHWPQSIHISQQQSLGHGHQMQRAHSFGDFGHHQHQVDSYSMSQQFSGHRQGMSGAPQHQQYHGAPQEQAPHHHIMHRAPSLPSHASYYVPEQNNPGVASLNTNPTTIPTYHLPRQVDRQEVLQSSPSSYSSVSRESPVSQDQYYTHHPAPQSATYSLPTESSAQQQSMLQYQTSMPHHLTQSLPSQSHTPEPYHHPSQAQEAQWYHNTAAYQPPIEVVNHIPSYSQVNHVLAFQDPWKVESYDDPSLQMPSARIENM